MHWQEGILIPVLVAAGLVVGLPASWTLLRPWPADELHRLGALSATAWVIAGTIWLGFALAGTAPPATPDHLRWPTPAHFVFAGGGLTLVAMAVDGARATLLSRLALAGVLVGVPVLAIEIGFAPELQWTGAVLVGIAATVVAIEQARAITAVDDLLARIFLVVGSMAVALGMMLGVGYGLSTRFAFRWLSIDDMVLTHGALNSIGFVVLSLLAWHRVHVGERNTPLPVETPT